MNRPTCDPKMTVRKQWQECLVLATQCRDLNERNGMLVAARLKRVEGLLSVVTGRSKEKNLYSAKGIATMNLDQHARARWLSKEVFTGEKNSCNISVS